MLGNERGFWGSKSSGSEPIRDRAPAVSCCHGQNPILGRGLEGNWIFRGIGCGRGLQSEPEETPDWNDTFESVEPATNN